MKAILSALFGCQHRKLSFVWTERKRVNSFPVRYSYQNCLDCGASWYYDLKSMTRGPRIER